LTQALYRESGRFRWHIRSATTAPWANFQTNEEASPLLLLELRVLLTERRLSSVKPWVSVNQSVWNPRSLGIHFF